MDFDGGSWAIPVLRFTAVVCWLIVLAKLRSTRQDSRIGGTVLVAAMLLFASSAIYLGAPMEWSTTVLNTASVAILAGGLWVLWRLPR